MNPNYPKPSVTKPAHVTRLVLPRFAAKQAEAAKVQEERSMFRKLLEESVFGGVLVQEGGTSSTPNYADYAATA